MLINSDGYFMRKMSFYDCPLYGCNGAKNKLTSLTHSNQLYQFTNDNINGGTISRRSIFILFQITCLHLSVFIQFSFDFLSHSTLMLGIGAADVLTENHLQHAQIFVLTEL